MALADNKEDAHDIILKWWDSMSIKKPVKCTTNPEYLEEFHSAAQPFLSKEKYGRPLIRTGTCEPNKGSNYKFKVCPSAQKAKLIDTSKLNNQIILLLQTEPQH